MSGHISLILLVAQNETIVFREVEAPNENLTRSSEVYFLSAHPFDSMPIYFEGIPWEDQGVFPPLQKKNQGEFLGLDHRWSIVG